MLWQTGALARLALCRLAKLALWQNWHWQIGTLAKLILWQTGALANWRSGKLALWQTGKTITLAKLALADWHCGKTDTLANWCSGKLALWQNWQDWRSGTLAKLSLWQNILKNAHYFGVWYSESLDDIRHNLYNYHAYDTLTTIMYIICDVFCALLQFPCIQLQELQFIIHILFKCIDF